MLPLCSESLGVLLGGFCCPHPPARRVPITPRSVTANKRPLHLHHTASSQCLPALGASRGRRACLPRRRRTHSRPRSARTVVHALRAQLSTWVQWCPCGCGAHMPCMLPSHARSSCGHMCFQDNAGSWAPPPAASAAAAQGQQGSSGMPQWVWSGLQHFAPKQAQVGCCAVSARAPDAWQPHVSAWATHPGRAPQWVGGRGPEAYGRQACCTHPHTSAVVFASASKFVWSNVSGNLDC